MTRLYAVARSAEEIAKHFAVDVSSDIDVPSETVEGTAGIVVIEKDGLCLLKSITGDFPGRRAKCARVVNLSDGSALWLT